MPDEVVIRRGGLAAVRRDDRGNIARGGGEHIAREVAVAANRIAEAAEGDRRLARRGGEPGEQAHGAQIVVAQVPLAEARDPVEVQAVRRAQVEVDVETLEGPSKQLIEMHGQAGIGQRFEIDGAEPLDVRGELRSPLAVPSFDDLPVDVLRQGGLAALETLADRGRRA